MRGQVQEIPGIGIEEMSEEDREDTRAEELRVLFKRLYGPAEGQEKFDLADKSDDLYLSHALIQMALFSVKQQCIIDCRVAEGCINDGIAATQMIQETFKKWMEEKQINPSNNQPIKPETFYFHNCHVDHYFREYNTNRIFNPIDFQRYKNQYVEAKLIWKGIKEPPENVKQLFEEIKKLMPEISVTFSFDDFFVDDLSPDDFRDMTANQIYEFLNYLAERDSLFGKAVKKMMDSEKFQIEYNKAEETSLTKLKNFVIKCLLTIYHSLKWWFTRDTIREAKEEWRKSCERATTSSELRCFRDYIVTTLESELNLPARRC